MRNSISRMQVRKVSTLLGLPLGIWLLVSANLTLRDHHYSIFAPDVLGASLSIFGDNAAVYGGALLLGLLGILCLAVPIDTLMRQIRRARG
jgi:hypothetical protein